MVTNAGIAVAGPVETLSRADMHRQFDVNVVGPLALTRAMLPRLRHARGRVVFISSINGRVSFPFTGMHNASKYALYAPHFAGERQMLGKLRRGAKPAERVAVAVERQLTRRRARPRTLVGGDARTILAMKTLLPARGLDAVWAQGIGV